MEITEEKESKRCTMKRSGGGRWRRDGMSAQLEDASALFVVVEDEEEAAPPVEEVSGSVAGVVDFSESLISRENK